MALDRMNLSTPATTHHVTAVITHRVKPGRESDYEDWIRGIAAAARQFAGHLGVSILRPQSGTSPDYVIVLQFDTCEHLTAWLHSAVRQDWIARVQPLIQVPESIQVLTGLEAWFQLPQPSATAAPKRYKQAVLVWLGVMIVALGVGPLIEPLLEPLPGLLALGIDVAITVALLTYLLMPWLTRWFRGWLFSPLH